MMFRGGFGGFGNCFGAGYGLMHRGWGMIIMLGIFALAAVAVILIARKTGRRHVDSAALEALKMRLARGEISEDEYIRRKAILD